MFCESKNQDEYEKPLNYLVMLISIYREEVTGHIEIQDSSSLVHTLPLNARN